jgi:hypothetical protein
LKSATFVIEALVIVGEVSVVCPCGQEVPGLSSLECELWELFQFGLGAKPSIAFVVDFVPPSLERDSEQASHTALAL